MAKESWELWHDAIQSEYELNGICQLLRGS